MPVTIENTGPCKMKMAFEIPAEDIQAKLESTVDELSESAQIPGFRPGHAPKRLVRRKLSDEIEKKVAADLAIEAYEAALKEHDIEVLSEDPDFDIDDLKLPDEGPLTFELNVEVKPEVEAPAIDDITVDVRKVDVTDANVEQALENLRRSRGRFVEQDQATGIAERDMLTADWSVTVDGETLHEETDATLAVFPHASGGIRLDHIVEALSGKTAGETVTFTEPVPDTHENEALRGKEAEVAVTVKAVRRIEMPPLDDDFAKSLGMDTVADVQKAVRERLENEMGETREAHRRYALDEWLVGQVEIEIPEGVAETGAQRAFNREVVNLQRRGIAVEQIEQQAEQLMAACRSRAERDLKLSFIVEALAKANDFEATEAEVQARVSMIAQNYGRPADRVYEDLERRGYLDAIREDVVRDKVYALLTSKATFNEVDPEEAAAASGDSTETASADEPTNSETPAAEGDAEGGAESADDETT